MLEYRTEGFKNFGVQYSPFLDSRIAVASGANYGLVGNGRLHILNLTPGGIEAEQWYDTQDCLYDLAWSETHANQLCTASGDGSLKLFDTGVSTFPVRQWSEHTREVFSTSWNLVSKDTLCSSSWDGTVKIYNPELPASLTTLNNNSCTYSALFSPHAAALISSVSSDSMLRIWDLRDPARPAQEIAIHMPISTRPDAQLQAPDPPSEALTHDWNKYQSTLVAVGGVDRKIRTIDVRMAERGPLAVLEGHGYAVRKVAWSPHLADLLLSGGYDMSVRVWRDGSAKGVEGGAGAIGGEVGRMSSHTEFVAGLDWCLFGAEGWCASAGWDERLLVWDVRSCMAR
ncbi:MAG: peroxisomal targeting signal 2 receptor [Vezdaea aestivalis]|nr:MAG: peroxisomal targeting signal 2 receptor [Vezdaea aestivalis]